MSEKINQLKSIKEKEAKIMRYYKRNIIKNEIKIERPKRKTRKNIKKTDQLDSSTPPPENAKHDKPTKLTKISPDKNKQIVNMD